MFRTKWFNDVFHFHPCDHKQTEFNPGSSPNILTMKLFLTDHFKFAPQSGFCILEPVPGHHMRPCGKSWQQKPEMSLCIAWVKVHTQGPRGTTGDIPGKTGRWKFTTAPMSILWYLWPRAKRFKYGDLPNNFKRWHRVEVISQCEIKRKLKSICFSQLKEPSTWKN